MNAPTDAAAPSQPNQDPLDAYSREDLLSLIEAQAAENNDLRQRADQFEHLYRDVMTSTAWKLSWPIRATFKVLTGLKDILTGANRKSGSTPAQTQANDQGQVTFDHQLSWLQTFAAPKGPARVNLVLTVPLSRADLTELLQQVAQAAIHRQARLRILTLDPAVTAQQCRAALPAGLEWVFQRLEAPLSTKNQFRLDFAASETVWVQTTAAQTYAARFSKPENIVLRQGGGAG